MTEYQQEAFDGDTDFARYRWEAQTGETKTFDRWLAEVERAAAEKAWEEGAEATFFNPEIRGFVDYPDNPYRLTEGEKDNV